jgi:hypothetical protein
VVNGEDPALFIAGFEYLPAGQSEYEFAGAIKGAPIEIVAGPQTGLPIPAHAEIVFEGELLPMSEITLPEGRSASSPATTPPRRAPPGHAGDRGPPSRRSDPARLAADEACRASISGCRFAPPPSGPTSRRLACR